MVFDGTDKYEIEIEIINSKIGPGTNYNSKKDIISSLKKCITHVLSGLQNSNYPISNSEKREVMEEYLKLIVPNETFDEFKLNKITSKSYKKDPIAAVRSASRAAPREALPLQARTDSLRYG